MIVPPPASLLGEQKNFLEKKQGIQRNPLKQIDIDVIAMDSEWFNTF